MSGIYIRLTWWVAVLSIFSVSAFGKLFRELDADYILSFLLIALSIYYAIKVRWHEYDWVWGPSFLVACVYMVLTLFEEVEANVLIQSLMFLIPLVSFIPRVFDIRLAEYKRIVYVSTVICVLGLLPYLSELIVALTSTAERNRFHTYFSILVCFLIISLMLAGEVRGKYKYLFLCLCIVVFTGAAAHRSLYLAYLVQFVYWAFVNGDLKSVVRPMLFLIAAGVLLLMTDFGGVIIQKFGDSMQGGDGNTESRLYYYEQILKNSANDFFGVGFGKFFLYGVDSKGNFVSYALQHNSYLSYLYFLGWPCFIWVVLWKLKIYASVRFSNDLFLKILSTTLVGMSFFAILNVYLEQPVFGLFYWLVFGLFVSRVMQLSSNPCRRLNGGEDV